MHMFYFINLVLSFSDFISRIDSKKQMAIENIKSFNYSKRYFDDS